MMIDLLRFLFFLLCRHHLDIHTDQIDVKSITDRRWSWIVSIRNSDDIHLCCGTIISSLFILTAAHCLRKTTQEWPSYSVLMGIDSLLDTNGCIRSVAEIFIHPTWNSTSQEHDLALLRLNTAIDLNHYALDRIPLPNLNQDEQIRYPTISSFLVAVGWGTTVWEDLLSPMYLRQVTLSVISEHEWKCRQMMTNVNVQFCAATVLGGEKDTCQGDSGGPIMRFSANRQCWILTGIISYGYRCELRDYVGVYTRISVFLDWIESIVGNEQIVTMEESSAHCLEQSLHLKTTLISILFILSCEH